MWAVVGGTKHGLEEPDLSKFGAGFGPKALVVLLLIWDGSCLVLDGSNGKVICGVVVVVKWEKEGERGGR